MLRLTRQPGTSEAASSRPLLRNVMYLSSGQVVTWAVSGLWMLFVPRSIGPAGMGQFVIASSITSLLTIFAGFGTNTLITKQVATDRSVAGRLLGATFLLEILVFPFCIALTALYVWRAGLGPQMTLIAGLATLNALVQLLIQPIQAAFQGIERMEYLVYGSLLTKMGGTIGGIALALTGHGVLALVEFGLAVSIPSLLLQFYWMTRHFKLDIRPGLAYARTILVQSLPYWATGLFLTFYVWIDSLLLSLLSSAKVVGWYGAPFQLLATLYFVPTILSTAWLPRLVAAFQVGELNRIARGLFELSLIAAAPVTAGTITMAAPLMTTLFGPAYLPSAPVLVILACGLPFTYLNIVGNQVLIARNRQIAWTKVMAAATVINPLINLLLIPYAQHHFGNGAVGAAASLLATEVMMAFAALILAPGILNRSSASRLARVALATLGMATIIEIAAPAGPYLQVGLGAIGFAFLTLLLRVVSDEQKREVGMLARRLVRRMSFNPASA